MSHLIKTLSIDTNFSRFAPWLRRVTGYGLALAIASLSALPAVAQTLSDQILSMERGLEQEFETYFGEDLAEVTQPPEDIALTLARIGEETGTNPAVLWVIPKGDHLHLVLITSKGEPVVRDLYEVPDDVLRRVVTRFHLEIHSSPTLGSLRAAKQLHEWIIEPLEADYLQAEGIDTILFCLGNGVRSLPLSALYDGEQFLLENYSSTRIPAFNLIQAEYVDFQPGDILAMGASEFEELNPLPAVPTELETILQELRVERSPQHQWDGHSFLNQEFTRYKLEQEIASLQPNVVHLATHAVFRPGEPKESYIQFWDGKLGLNEMGGVNWGDSVLELLVLSACRTAIGDDRAELGFAGLALKSGVKSALGSLWNVNDSATLALMGEFYRQLGTAPTKAEALRQAQLKMLRGEIQIEGDRLLLSRGSVPLPPELTDEEIRDFSAPYYWAAFTMISSPW
ncbi:CHAT domain-containing protein [Roseofilum capinflatum]|uniref:CHAT domain-containing protein n=1 Tax=Roseofilum capinflatum BLCC-M114 TaxID=3022440 RepID=A0ABT7B8Q4_9CYAN|nr:CHAT domain-containing protein [Roseofilum capinflatum]MDJ1175558.1 CHAT domain-containing protein [Roseofilum capinflatum BLCC-M114]